jgi:hypothetical protein
MMSKEKCYKGSCFCGAVRLTVSGEPAGMGCCDCESCRNWSAGPFKAFTLLKPEAVQITRGADKVGTYHKTPHSHRMSCTGCGGHLYTEHPGVGLIDVYAAVIPDFPYRNGFHDHGPETKQRIKIALQKMHESSTEMAGAGTGVAE